MQKGFEVPYAKKAIRCVRSFQQEDDDVDSHEAKLRGSESSCLIFTHGAGGTLNSDGIADFSSGFATRLPLVCFQGNMNLKSRVKMFSEVMKNQDFESCLGGRSMGARAAVMAATLKTKLLVLESYPLHTDKETRDQILLDIDPSIEVLFAIGDKDSMCDLTRLDSVRKRMKCRTWLLVVQGADHGMKITPKAAISEVGRKTGEIAADWIETRDSERREGRVFWDQEVKWVGWTPAPHGEIELDNPKISTAAHQTSKRGAEDNASSRAGKRRKL